MKSKEMEIVELRQETNRASRIHALLKLRSDAEVEVAKLLREELDAVGEEKWLVWCKQEFGWQRTSAYKHLNPKLLQKDRERKRNVQNSERCQNGTEATEYESSTQEADGPTIKEVAQRDPLAKILLEMIPMIRKWPIERVYQKMSRDYNKKGVGYDKTTVKALNTVREWLDQYIKTMEQFVVSCSTKT